jgi:hypothetical protein
LIDDRKIRIRTSDKRIQNRIRNRYGTVYKKAVDTHMSGEAELCFEIFAAVLAAVE